MKRVFCTVAGALIGGLTGILVGAVAGASDLSKLDRTIKQLEMARDVIRAENEREKATEASHEHPE